MRGNTAPDGTTRVAKNGYSYTKQDGKWRLTHHILAEEKLGRCLEEGERVSFADGKRANLKKSNIVITVQGFSSLRRRKAQIESRILELQAELRRIEKQLRTSS